MTGERTDVVVIGAGVVGLAIARRLALAGRDVLVLESQNAIGTGTSSRNSEVIHAGLYYPPGSLKATFCTAGKQQLYAYCMERGVTAKRVGKILVATSEDQLPKLQALKTTAEQNGVTDLCWLTADDVKGLEPEIFCVQALFSPSSGVVDSHAYMLALQGDLENAGGMIAFGAEVRSGRISSYGVSLDVGGTEAMQLECRLLVNAAGLHAGDIARRIDGLPNGSVPPQFFAKGNYFALSGVKSPFHHLIYPMPEQAGLGVHATIDLGSQTKFGPDVEWVEAVEYSVNPSRRDRFYASIRRYWPGLPDNALVPSYCGIRPKIVGPGMEAADFMISGPRQHGVPGLINLFGIESPGLTCSMAIAEHVAEMSLVECLAA